MTTEKFVPDQKKEKEKEKEKKRKGKEEKKRMGSVSTEQFIAYELGF